MVRHVFWLPSKCPLPEMITCWYFDRRFRVPWETFVNPVRFLCKTFVLMFGKFTLPYKYNNGNSTLPQSWIFWHMLFPFLITQLFTCVSVLFSIWATTYFLEQISNTPNSNLTLLMFIFINSRTMDRWVITKFLIQVRFVANNFI